MISGNLVKHGNVVLDMHEGAELIIDGELEANANLPDGSAQECIIRIYKGARMHVKGKFQLYYGTTVQVFHGGMLSLGSGFFNCNTVVGVGKEMHIGDSFMGARNVTLYDSDFHSIYQDGSRINPAETVRIGNHVWVGFGAMILKGVTIGDGAIIGAKSLVTDDVFPNCMAVGMPARTIKRNVSWK